MPEKWHSLAPSASQKTNTITFLNYGIDFLLKLVLMTSLILTNAVNKQCILQRPMAEFTGWETTYLIEETPEGPDVRLKVVSVFVDPLWWHVIRCPHWGRETYWMTTLLNNKTKTWATFMHMFTFVLCHVCDLPKEWAAVVLELKKRPRPRSPSFTSPVAVMKTLAGLISGSKTDTNQVLKPGNVYVLLNWNRTVLL